ncbi:hypothetical protein A8135_09870 [Legionella jamestowniensis]|uniref:Uncharacterized protein n=1 Tax=Legionella jamestowniensis TaxID=455 RepID=A0ABX2XWS4_9GAMM|nr:hypothetical protein [Legionella jamestowniensis]OCH99040.1 hypothetical protein A8135_09870 [Legionella jamestowniensis]
MKRGRQTQSNGTSISEACFNDLLKHNLISEEIWMPKEKGNQAGVIIIDKNFKKTFVKRYDPHDYNNNELTDFIIFKLAKKCGVRTPEVRLVFTSDYAYLLSIDMNYSKKTGKSYSYQDIDNLSHSDFDLYTIHQGFFKKREAIFRVDQLATAGLLILSVVLNLTDLSDANLGIVLSETTNQKKAKIALMDFNCTDKSILQGEQNTSFKQFILEKISSKNRYLFAMGETLSDCDYYAAFEKISANFIPSLDKSAEVIVASKNEIKQKEAHSFLTLWQKNFTCLSDFIHLCNQSNPVNI